jgi:hypothetical protein
MNNELSKITLMSVFYEQKKSFFDVYTPFILQVCRKNDISKLSEIEGQLDNIFGFKLPINVIKTILTENEFILFSLKKPNRSDWEITLTDKGKENADKLFVEEEEVNKDIEYLENDVIGFFKKEYGIQYEKDEIHKNIKIFLEKNANKYHERKKLVDDGKCNEFDIDFIIYLNTAVRIDDKKDSIIERMWKGIILLSQMENNKSDKHGPELIEKLDIYIDTNIIFSLLQLHSDIVNKSISELFDLIYMNNKIHVFVLDTTIAEFERMLYAYESVKNDFYDIEVDSVFYHLKRNGYDSAKILNLKENVIKLLSEKGVEFRDSEYLESLSLKYYSHLFTPLYSIRISRNKNLPERIQKNENVIEKAAHHDAFMIGYTLQFKNKRTYNFVETKALFLTSSGSLFYDYLNLYKGIENYPVVIRDITLTNILYMLNPKEDTGPKLEQILSAHTNILFIDSTIWQKYVSALKEMLERETIDIKQYALLVSNNKAVLNYISGLKIKDVDNTEVTKLLTGLEEEKNEQQTKIKTVTIEIAKKEEELEKIRKDKIKIENENEVLKVEIEKIKADEKTFRYNMNMEREISPKIKKEIRKKIAWTMAYLAIIAVSITLFIKLDAHNKYFSLLVFVLPWIRSFVKHENIIYNVKIMLNRKIRKQYYIEVHAILVEEYEKANPHS